jgi:hypothetical protein
MHGHIVHKHPDVEDATRLREVRRLGMLWRDHWISNSHGGKNNSTRKKLDEVIRDDFDWVWGPRP